MKEYLTGVSSSMSETPARIKNDAAFRRGAENPNTVLTEAAVLAIYNSTDKPSAVAAEFGIHPNTVYLIRAGRRWAWLTGQSRDDASGGAA